MKEIVKTSRLAGQLEKLFRILNFDWFNGELERQQTGGKRDEISVLLSIWPAF